MTSAASPDISDTNLVWMDLEMTGLDVERDRILEIAVIVTDQKLRILAEGPVIAVHQSEEVLAGMDDWNREHHTASGLVERVRNSTVGEKEAERIALGTIKRFIPEKKTPLCGSSIWQDRRFLCRYMPELEAWFFHRNIDVSSIKELARIWRPELLTKVVKRGRHEALSDIQDTIAELRLYAGEFLRLPKKFIGD